MKRDGVLHGELSKIIAELGHGQKIVIADYGLPVPKHVKLVDLAVTKNIPSFLHVLDTVLSELKVEGAVVASEIEQYNGPLLKEILDRFGGSISYVSHTEFKKLTEEAKVIVRTGEWAPYANVILDTGVVF